MSTRRFRTMTPERRTGSGTATPSNTTGSMTVTNAEAGPSSTLGTTHATLRLRAEAADTEQGRHIQWAEDVVDNEGMGKKSSKVCCIYHKPRKAGESSSEDESSSSSSDESDSEPDLSRAQRAAPRRRLHRHEHSHDDPAEDCRAEPSEAAPDGRSSKGKGHARPTGPNAYEKVPRRKDAKG